MTYTCCLCDRPISPGEKAFTYDIDVETPTGPVMVSRYLHDGCPPPKPQLVLVEEVA